VTNSKKKTAGI